MKKIVSITLLAVLLPTMSFAADEMHREEQQHTQGVEALSHELRDLLSKEMKALQDGMVSIIPAYVSGEWNEIAATATKMKNSYILKQSLTKDQMKELHQALPPRFIEMDQNFHYLAGMLSHAAEMKKPELVNFYFSEMNEACQSCHVKFATHKFPAFAPKLEKEHSHGDEHKH